jgi:hypothetical protein
MAWISQRLGRPVSVQMGWAYLVRPDGNRHTLRPRHVKADPADQEVFKKDPAARPGGGHRFLPGPGGAAVDG